MNQHVMIFAESVDGKLSSLAKELLGRGRQLADALGKELHVLLIGEVCIFSNEWTKEKKIYFYLKCK